MAAVSLFGTPIWPPWRHVKTLYRDKSWQTNILWVSDPNITQSFGWSCWTNDPPRSTHYSGCGIVTTTERLIRKQTACSKDRKSVSLHDNTVFDDLAHVQGSVHVIVVWSGCFRETSKDIRPFPSHKILHHTPNSSHLKTVAILMYVEAIKLN